MTENSKACLLACAHPQSRFPVRYAKFQLLGWLEASGSSHLETCASPVSMCPLSPGLVRCRWTTLLRLQPITSLLRSTAVVLCFSLEVSRMFLHGIHCECL